MPARHILTYAQTLGNGGVERAMLRLVRGWVAAERRVTLVLGSRTGSEQQPDGIEIVDLGSSKYTALLKLPGIVAERAPDILFCPGNHYTSAAAWTRLRLGRRCPPIVAKMSNAPARADHGIAAALAQRVWLAQHGRFLDHLVAMTPATADAADRALGMAGRVSVIPNPPLVPAGPLPPPDPNLIVGVGRLAPQKRWDRLIAAMPLLAPETRLAIFGEGPLRGALLAQADALGLGQRVALPGQTGDPLAAMAGAAVVALTSDYEGVPGVLREALSVGTPVVATASSAAIPEIVTDPALGTIVPRDDPVALAAALRHHFAAPRPAPVVPPGADAATRYLALFDRLA